MDQAFNSHSLEDILSHYAEDIVVTTPMIRLTTGCGTGTLQGNKAVGDYWAAALKKIPDLHFKLIQVTAGVDSIAMCYRSVMGKVAIEVMFFNDEGKVNRMFAHYT